MVENEPTSYREAVTSSEGQQLREAIKSEIESILQNHTWELVDLPPGCKPLGYKWIFKKKMKADGTVDKYKARLIHRKRTPNKPYTTAFEQSFQQFHRSETLVFSRDLSGKLSSPAVQQLWTLYPGKQTGNLILNTSTSSAFDYCNEIPNQVRRLPTQWANHAERPKNFNGQNFKRWQQKMFFYLTTLGLARFLKETAPQVEPPAKGQSSNAQAVQAVEAWKYSDFLCHNYVLNGYR
ncbi:pol polyprotein [Tanacetum coccineum]|uniref:Pol polyprotein n=1 Tax=Tanacetum coccineum TaxID=301880 RepID=A0ABQ5E7S0_9ASTR